ncbi:VCBS domain-containing protein, partial [Undibacterium sp.]|uniref:VCBS domain-containing protein n=1 Tax=Undibacterium sp. TaxID=1914977 RepID=UPI0037538786
ERVLPAGNLTDSGTIAFSDADLTDIHSIGSITPSSGALGSLSASVSTDSTGSGTGGVITWQYSVPGAAVEYLAAGQTKLETFSFNVLDGQGGSVTRTVNVTIVGTNDAPIAFNDVGNATENGGAANATAGSNASGNVLTNDTDIDTANASLLVTAIRTGGIEGAGTAGVVGSTLNGRFGTLSIDSTGAYTYVVNQADATVQALNVGGSLTDTFNYTVRDGSLSDNGVLTVTIRGSNDDPVAPNVALQINQLGNGGFEASPDFSGWRVNTATTGLTSGSGTATINRAGTAIAGDSAVAVLTFGGNVPGAYGTGYGPTITSDAFNGRSGDTVKFVYELTSGGDQAIGTGYIRDAQTNAIVQTIFNYQVPFTGSSGVKTVNLTLAQSGNFIIDFRIGSYDATGGRYVGATMELGFAGIIRDGLSEDTPFTFTGNNFLSGVTDVDGGVPVLSSVSANSAANASLVLSGGNIIYDPRVALNYLAANQEFIDTFSYIVSDGKGGFDTATASVKVIGVNDVPVVASADVTGTVTEQVTPIGNLTNSGTIGFSDVDLTDVHSISAVTSSAGALGTLVASISTDTTGSGSGGVITWNYVVPASAVEYLTAGQTKVETFNFNVLDGNGGVVPRSVSVTINGTSEPINLWNADGNAVDQIGANNGTLFNGVGFAPGHTGQAFSFDGVNDYVRVNDTIRNDFTVTGWLKTTANSPTGNQFYQGNGLVYADVGGAANDFGISILNDRIAFGTGNPDTTIQSNSIVTTGNWVQFAAVRSGSVISIYINGALESTIDTHNALTLNGPTAITLGGNTVDGRYFSGLLDDITFYDHALTPVEIVGVAVGPFV